MRRIVWLASYPKSGSTWFRALLANLEPGRTGPAQINALGSPLASSRLRFDCATGIEGADLTFEEVDRLRPQIFRHLTAPANDGEPQFFKIHDAFFSRDEGRPMIPSEATRGAIYLVRNPLDVCASYAHHSGWDIDATINHMADAAHGLVGRADRLDIQMRQHLSSWSGHVLSWLDNGRIPVHVVRYEDLQARTIETAASAIAFAGMARECAQIERAIDWSRFERLQAQERDFGFIESSSIRRTFFRHGAAGGWQKELTPGQVTRIFNDHGAVMRRLGYVEAK